jgi:TonB family protein
MKRIALFLPLLCLAWTVDVQAAGDVLLVRYALLVGGRQAGTAPSSAGVLSQEDLTKVLIEWNPGADNAEVRRTFALNDLGEVARQAVELPVEGGQVQGTYSHGGASFEVRLDIKPVKEGVVLSGQMLRNGKVLSTPRVLQALGERAILSSTGGPEAPFLFCVIEVDRVSREALRQQGDLRSAWSRDGKVVDGKKIPAPRLVKKVDPAYTPAAKEARVSGTVILRILVGKTGEVEDVEVLKGLPKGLTESAIAAVRQWRYEPATIDGRPAPVLFTITVNFTPD